MTRYHWLIYNTDQRDKTNKNMWHHLFQLERAKNVFLPPREWQRAGRGESGRCKGWGGGAEYVLIGAPVKQLEGHILARTWPISLESASRDHLSFIAEEEKKGDAASERNLPLLGARASLQLNALFWLNKGEDGFLMPAHLSTYVSWSTFHPNSFV